MTFTCKLIQMALQGLQASIWPSRHTPAWIRTWALNRLRPSLSDPQRKLLHGRSSPSMAVVTGLRRSGGLRGGVLPASYDLRRATADVDLAATVLPGDIERIGQLIASIAQVLL